MNIHFWSIGKPNETYIKDGVEEFTNRISRYFKVEWKIIAPPKNAGLLPEVELKKAEAAIIIDLLKDDDYLVLLDETGKTISSEDLANLLQQRANERTKKIVFLVGGAYGVDGSVTGRANFTWSLSKLVFPHMLVRLILAEQVYRACTILRNEKYHHQ
jgi:23S rRNA (pseudouridine1915-N3)-methyltransferase